VTLRSDIFSNPDRRGEAILTDREGAIACLIAAGLTNREVARELSISHHTVAQHVATMLHRFGARSRCELVARAYAVGTLATGVWPPCRAVL
jgi:DNA-binding CsgD family transcriptional regulator